MQCCQKQFRVACHTRTETGTYKWHKENKQKHWKHSCVCNPQKTEDVRNTSANLTARKLYKQNVISALSIKKQVSLKTNLFAETIQFITVALNLLLNAVFILLVLHFCLFHATGNTIWKLRFPKFCKICWTFWFFFFKHCSCRKYFPSSFYAFILLPLAFHRRKTINISITQRWNFNQAKWRSEKKKVRRLTI